MGGDGPRCHRVCRRSMERATLTSSNHHGHYHEYNVGYAKEFQRLVSLSLICRIACDATVVGRTKGKSFTGDDM